MKTIEVVAAIIRDGDKFLCVQRGQHKFEYLSSKWEFPGGKVEANESSEEALKREIQEELQVEITNLEFFCSVKHNYPDFGLNMHTFICTSLKPSISLTEHINSDWLSPDQMTKLDWAAADIPIVNALKSLQNEAH